MAGNWTKLTAVGRTENLDDIVAVMSMLDNGLMIEDFSDFFFSGICDNRIAIKISGFEICFRKLVTYHFL